MEDNYQDVPREEPEAALTSELKRLRNLQVYVGKGVVFRGQLSYEGTIRVDGTIEGEIQTNDCLLIGEGAVVLARVIAGTVICKGQVKGDIIARERVRLRAPAVVTGSITATIISFEEGAQFNGEVTMTGNQVLEEPEYQPEVMAIEPELAAAQAS